MWNVLYRIPIAIDMANHLFQWNKSGEVSNIHFCNNKCNHPEEYVM